MYILIKGKLYYALIKSTVRKETKIKKDATGLPALYIRGSE